MRRQHHPNATTTYFNYDLAGRLSEKVTVKDADTSVLVRFAYTRDAAGNPIAIERESGLGVFYYQYDVLQRLAYEGQSMGAYFAYETYYEYDAAGNRSSRHLIEGATDTLFSYTCNAANELTQGVRFVNGQWSETREYEYDANGNLAWEAGNEGVDKYYRWDGRDLMAGYRETWGGPDLDTYRYDGLGTRVATQEQSTLTYFDWAGTNVIQEKDATNTVTDRQVHGYAPIPSVGDIALMDKSGTPYVPLADQVGSTAKLLNSAASVANSYTYDAFGMARSASESVANRYRFGTKRLDADSALYHFVARQYVPQLGIFAARDKMSFGFVYGYCLSRPLSMVDPSGMSVFGYRFCCTFEEKNIRGWGDIGNHTSNSDGIIFTCRCGWLDTGHIRQAMDTVLKYYLQLRRGAPKGTRVAGYDWAFTLTQNIAAKDSVAVAASLTYDEGVVHEIRSFIPWIPPAYDQGEFSSSFSPEDLPSNTVGVYLAETALAKGGPWNSWTLADLGSTDKQNQWGEEMQKALRAALDECVDLTQAEAHKVWNGYVRDKWVSERGGLTLLKRNMDFQPWNIACPECNKVKDKSVPTWLKNGIALTRDSYHSDIDILLGLAQVRQYIIQYYGAGMLSP